MGFLLSEKTYFQIPYLCRTEKLFQASAVDRSGRPSLKSVDRISRPTCTDVHAFVHWRTVDRVGRPLQRALLSGNIGRPVRSTDREFTLCSSGSVDRDGRPEAPTVGFLTVGGRPARSTGSSDRPQRSDFSDLYKLGFCHCFHTRFWRLLEPVFLILLEEFSPQNSEQIFPI